MKKRATRVERTRNANTLTEAEYFSRIRSALRRTFRFWKPMFLALQAASRPYKGKSKNQKWEYQCAKCKKWFKRTDVEIDHIVGCGELRKLEDIPGFIERLTCEDVSCYQVLCKPHHLEKTIEEK